MIILKGKLKAPLDPSSLLGRSESKAFGPNASGRGNNDVGDILGNAVGMELTVGSNDGNVDGNELGCRGNSISVGDILGLVDGKELGSGCTPVGAKDGL